MSTKNSHLHSYPRFLWHAVRLATAGSLGFYAWMTVLTAVALVGLHAWASQTASGMVLTHMTDQVSWGLYIANFTFAVGLAAGAVMMVIPAYLYHDEDMHDLTIIGELLAVAAISVCLMFVVADLGRPDRFWHMIPLIGRFHWPISMLTWDVLVLNGYLLLNLHICGYLLYMRFLGRRANPKWYVPFVFLSIGWAISIHTVTAFLYSGLGGRPFWNSAILAPRFIVSAFVSGPAFIVAILFALQRFAGLPVGNGPIKTLTRIMQVTLPIDLFMVGSEVFTEFYTGGAHVSAAKYLYFGLHGKSALVPWIWTAIACNVVALFLLMRGDVYQRPKRLLTAAGLAFVGLWIEKGMGLIIPGFVPSTLHELVEYRPSLVEWQIAAGVWAAGLLILSAALKIALPVLQGTLAAHSAERHPGGSSAS
ncbi:MAG: polysulfide reductase NrfD [Deltaproteobacteria bacterium]|nr:polysulfide reductase NrfD [Deltaproteobacteria bacterium]